MFKGEEWENSIALGMLKAHCFLPILSYGATAILAATSQEPKSMIASSPLRRRRAGSQLSNLSPSSPSGQSAPLYFDPANDLLDHPHSPPRSPIRRQFYPPSVSVECEWPTKPLGLLRLKGLETDAEDLLLKVAYTRCCYLVPVVITK